MITKITAINNAEYQKMREYYDSLRKSIEKKSLEYVKLRDELKDLEGTLDFLIKGLQNYDAEMNNFRQNNPF